MEIMDVFADNLKDLLKIKILTSEHLESTSHNKLNETHSLIWGTLYSSISQLLGDKCVVAIGRSLRSESMRRRFTPDISLWSPNGTKTLIAIVDYESTNSSDSRIIRRNLKNYRQYVETSLDTNIPNFWIILTTLPSKKVSKANWYSWDLRRKRMSKDEYLKLLENPYEYWLPKYSKAFEELREHIKKCPLYVANLSSTNLMLYLPKHKAFSIRLTH